jgi:cytidine diphosphoramidate kinase
MIIWIIGLSGAGKTTLGKELCGIIKNEKPNTVFIDGDMVREIMGNDLGHSLEDRRKNAGRICRLCKVLEEQRINVVCAILSIFPESREWNRINFRQYFEVYIDVPMDVLIKRNQKGLYAAALEGKRNDVIGINIPFEKPVNPDYTFYNTLDLASMGIVALDIFKKLPPLD